MWGKGVRGEDGWGGRRAVWVALVTFGLAISRRTISEWPLLEGLLDWGWNGGALEDALRLSLWAASRVLRKVGLLGVRTGGTS